MAAKRSTWIAGAAAVGVLVVAGTWMFGVSPVLDETQSIKDQESAAAAENAALEARLVELASASENLPQLKAELAALQVGIPATEQVDAFLRDVDAIQAAREIAVVSIEVSDPVTVVDNQGLTSVETVQPEATDDATAATDDATASTGAATSDAGTSASTTTTAGVPSGFIAVPVKITVVGGFGNALALLTDLQGSDGRLFLVTAVTGEGQGEAEAGDGRPATSEGDVEMVVTGNLYVLVDQGASSDETGDETTGGLPAFDSGKAALGSSS